MVFHLAAFDESQDTATLANVATVADTILRTNGDDLYVDRTLSQIIGIYALGATIARAQLRSPSMLNYWYYEISGLDLSAEPSSPQIFHDLRFTPLQLAPTEALNAQIAEAAAGAEREIVLVWFSDGPITPVEADVRTLRFTASATLTANAWTNVQLTADQQMPAGEYEIVGMRAEAAGCIAARLVFRDNPYRPGVAGVDAQSDIQFPGFRRGGMGSFGRFFHDALPSVDFLSISADTAEVVYLDLIQRSRL